MAVVCVDAPRVVSASRQRGTSFVVARVGGTWTPLAAWVAVIESEEGAVVGRPGEYHFEGRDTACVRVVDNLQSDGPFQYVLVHANSRAACPLDVRLPSLPGNKSAVQLVASSTHDRTRPMSCVLQHVRYLHTQAASAISTVTAQLSSRTPAHAPASQ